MYSYCGASPVYFESRSTIFMKSEVVFVKYDSLRISEQQFTKLINSIFNIVPHCNKGNIKYK
jgi:hypothetical protein